ncbi:MAG: hypothetical protein RBS48_01820 [Ignavibacteriaceae bacterium]|jgi:ABC-type nitrate/sulfonate/bicarbonate transport system permease component|nr:hypothetical protein [Ignavibacteriaceae bacterium]
MTYIWFEFISILQDYFIVQNLAFTSTVVYSALALLYIVLYFILHYTPSIINCLITISEKLSFIKYLPVLVLAIILNLLFPGQIWSEFVFAFLFSFVLVIIQINKTKSRTNPEYSKFAKDLSINFEVVKEKLYFSNLFRKIKNIHYEVWLLILVYEFINGQDGLGGVLKKGFIFDDLYAVLVTGLIIGLLIWVVDFLVSFLKK